MILAGSGGRPARVDRQLMRNSVILVEALLAMALGCASPQPVARPRLVTPPRAAPPPPAPPKRIRLAVLPVEKLLLPRTAEALNERLRGATIDGVSETTTATISMEVAAMQLDCTQQTDQCYGQIARHFEADRLLWAEIERAGRGKRKKGPTTIRIVLFDVQQPGVVGRAEQTFAGAVSNEALDQLLGRAIVATRVEPRASPP
jgi:hypothetical protein